MRFKPLHFFAVAIAGWMNRQQQDAIAYLTAWAATRTKGTYLASQYHLLAGRRGRKQAIVAVGHS